MPVTLGFFMKGRFFFFFIKTKRSVGVCIFAATPFSGSHFPNVPSYQDLLVTCFRSQNLKHRGSA